jgi:predicted HTH transcriptional regulator
MLGVLRDALKELVNASSDSSQLEVKETNEEKVLLLLSKNGKLTAKGLATEIGISQRQVERIVNNLKVSGKIQRIGDI